MSEMTAFSLRLAAVVLTSFAAGAYIDRWLGIPFTPIWITLAGLALYPVVVRVYAIRSLRMVYTWRGVFLWLKGRKRTTGQRGIVAVLRSPEKVTDEMHALAEGAFA